MNDIKRYKMNCPVCNVKPIPGKTNWKSLKYDINNKILSNRICIGFMMISINSQLKWQRN